MVYTATQHIIDPDPIPPSLNRKLPQLVEYFARKPHKTLTEEYLTLLSHWMRNLERSYYKTAQYQTVDKYDRRLDRIILFVQFTREESHRDGALLMTMWRFQFSNVEVLMMLQNMRIAVATDKTSVLQKLRSTDVQYVKQLLSIELALAKKGLQFTFNNALDEWKQYRKRISKNGKEPGERAVSTFKDKYDSFRSVFDLRREYERAWVNRAGSVENN